MIDFIRKNYAKLGMAFALSMLVINYFQQKELAKLRSEKIVGVVVKNDENTNKIIDSLNAEIFNLQTINGRYEMAVELLKERNVKAGKQFEEILSSETE